MPVIELPSHTAPPLNTSKGRPFPAMSSRPLAFAALGEAGLGLVLLANPTLVVQLLFGAEIAGAGIVTGRVAGIALISLGVACWPGRSALVGMLTWSALITAYVTWLAMRGEWVGPLLWPAVVLHAVLTLVLAAGWHAERTADGRSAGS